VLLFGLMPATINYRGFQITVPTSELAEALRQLRLATALQQAELPLQASSADAESDLSIPSVSREKRTDKELTLDFLKLIGEHRVSGGAPLASVMKALGVSHAKGVGSKAAVINRVLDAAGFATPDVYTNPRDAMGFRFWQPGPRLNDAIAVLSGSALPKQEAEQDQHEDEL
jgi:hypothetical protein